MNVALPALIVFLVLLPGFIFRIRFKRVERTSLDFSPFGRIAAGAVTSAAVAHLIWLALTYLAFGRRFEPIVLMQLLSSAPASQIEAAAAVAEDFGKDAMLYTGVLDSFYFDAEGQLDRLVLQGVSRRPLANDKTIVDDADRFYPVDGDSFVLRYSEMITLNVQYVHLG
jgi:hypothetical protein